MSPNRSSRVPKTLQQRKDYLNAFASSTVEVPDTTGSATSTSQLEQESSKPSGKRPVPHLLKVQRFLSEHLVAILSGLVGSAALWALTHVWGEYSSLNREVGSMTARVEGLEKRESTFLDRLDGLGTLRFMADQLWSKVFGKAPPASDPKKK